MRNGVVINNHIHPVGPIPTVAVPVDVPAQIPVPVENLTPAAANGIPFLVASVPQNNTFSIDTDQQFVAMVVRLAQNSGNILSQVVLPPWD